MVLPPGLARPRYESFELAVERRHVRGLHLLPNTRIGLFDLRSDAIDEAATLGRDSELELALVRLRAPGEHESLAREMTNDTGHARREYGALGGEAGSRERVLLAERPERAPLLLRHAVSLQYRPKVAHRDLACPEQEHGQGLAESADAGHLAQQHNTLSIFLWQNAADGSYAVAMHILLLVIVVLAIVIGPGLWVGAVMQRYHHPRDRYAETGGQTARKLLDSLGLDNVGTEVTDRGDHYDPAQKVVRLSPDNFNGRSLTALTVAAHEVGHAIQDASGFKPLRWRTRLVRWAGPIEKIGAGMLMVSPFLALTPLRVVGIASFLAGLATLATGIFVHALTLPTEFDASFSRALPILRDQAVLRAEDMPRARKLLTAAALTYVSGALQSLLNIARWWAILRR